MTNLTGMFQSLRGFGVGWSTIYASNGEPLSNVSIPERVWGGLERLSLNCFPSQSSCFNP